MSREQLNLDGMTVDEFIIAMSEGNPGALTVCLQCTDNNLVALLFAEEMNIRGAQLWVAYKYWAEFHLNKLCEGLIRRNAEMIEVVNRECPEHVAFNPKGRGNI